ncbi:MAG: hypothetical protein RIS76_4552 [Verrucomicrobiota bacterium]|jgi:GT2 family glycosyltransferase
MPPRPPSLKRTPKPRGSWMNPVPPARPSTTLAPPVTLCVACYGPHADLAHRFLSSLYSHTDPALFTLRAGLNEAEPETHRLFAEFSRRYANVELTVEPRNVFKNPLMRRLFHEKPLSSRWTLWCDDDTHFTDDGWMPRLGQAMESAPEISMWGAVYYLECHHPEVVRWIQSARWYRAVPLVPAAPRDGSESAGVRFDFATGGFWALRTQVIHQLNWPDPRLVQAGEDFLLAEALRQNGLTLGHFSEGIRSNDAPRRNPHAPEIVEIPR